MNILDNNAKRFWEGAYESEQHIAFWDYKFPSQELVTFLATGLIPRKANCLDIGCGAGNEAIFLSQCGHQVTGMDLSEKALSIARKRAEKNSVLAEWIQGDALCTGLKSKSFDFINDRGCFHHIKEHDRQRFANEMARLLKPGGRMLLRGSREGLPNGFFVPVNERTIDKYFTVETFFRGQILPITILADHDVLNANVVVLTKK